MELVVNNGKCAICGKQIGPLTGDPRTFESIEGVRQGFPGTGLLLDEVPGQGRERLKENQSRWYPAPFSSSLCEGPMQKGIDITQGELGTQTTVYFLPAWPMRPTLWG